MCMNKETKPRKFIAMIRIKGRTYFGSQYEFLVVYGINGADVVDALVKMYPEGLTNYYLWDGEQGYNHKAPVIVQDYAESIYNTKFCQADPR